MSAGLKLGVDQLFGSPARDSIPQIMKNAGANIQHTRKQIGIQPQQFRCAEHMPCKVG